jgi:hypothetical protein
MLTARELNDPSSPRIRRYRDRFAAATPPDPSTDDWRAWETLLHDQVPGDGEPPESAMRFARADGFATVSSALIALPELGRKIEPVGRFASVAPQPSGWAALGTP